jgi:hypothetical protein
MNGGRTRKRPPSPESMFWKSFSSVSSRSKPGMWPPRPLKKTSSWRQRTPFGSPVVPPVKMT